MPGTEVVKRRLLILLNLNPMFVDLHANICTITQSFSSVVYWYSFNSLQKLAQLALEYCS